MDRLHAEFVRILEIQRTVINEQALLSTPLGHLQRQPIKSPVRLAQSNITGAEEQRKVAPQLKCLDSIFVEFTGLVVDGRKQITARFRNVRQDRASFRIFSGLRKHKGRELLAREPLRPAKNCAVQIL